MFRHTGLDDLGYLVSMESGLEDRNNFILDEQRLVGSGGLNGVRPRRPEQCKAAP